MAGQETVNLEITHLPAIIKFTNRYKRNQVCVSFYFISEKIDNFPVESIKRLYVNETLTQKRKKLFGQTKQKAKKYGL